MSETGGSERSIDDILAMASDPAYHRVVTARMSFVPQQLRDEHARLDALLPTLVSDTIDAHPQRLETAQRIADIESEMEAALIEFRFKGIGRRQWADLLAEHPPTKQQKLLDRNAPYDDTFEYAAIAASCVQPAMTVEQVRALDASGAVDVQGWNELWSSCLRANVREAVPNSPAASRVLMSEESSRRHITTESHAASFLDES